MWRLEPCYSDAAPSPCYLYCGADLSVSRQADAWLQLTNDKSISRKHATLRVQHDIQAVNRGEHSSVMLEDLRPKNGTFFKCAPVSSDNSSSSNDSALLEDFSPSDRVLPGSTITLHDGDVVRFGLYSRGCYRLRLQRLLVCSSMLSPDATRPLLHHLLVLGGAYTKEWREECSHLVMPGVKLSAKVPCALAHGAAVVTPGFLAEMCTAVQEGHVLLPPTASYLPPIMEPGIQPSPALFERDSRRRTLLAGMIFIFCTVRARRRVADIVLAAGGVADLLCSSHFAKLASGDALLVRTAEDTRKEPTPFITEALDVVRTAKLHPIPESDIVLAVLYCNTDLYCNPALSQQLVLAEPVEVTQPRIVLAPETQNVTSPLGSGATNAVASSVNNRTAAVPDTPASSSGVSCRPRSSVPRSLASTLSMKSRSCNGAAETSRVTVFSEGRTAGDEAAVLVASVGTEQTNADTEHGDVADSRRTSKVLQNIKYKPAESLVSTKNAVQQRAVVASEAPDSGRGEVSESIDITLSLPVPDVTPPLLDNVRKSRLSRKRDRSGSCESEAVTPLHKRRAGSPLPPTQDLMEIQENEDFFGAVSAGAAVVASPPHRFAPRHCSTQLLDDAQKSAPVLGCTLASATQKEASLQKENAEAPVPAVCGGRAYVTSRNLKDVAANTNVSRITTVPPTPTPPPQVISLSPSPPAPSPPRPRSAAAQLSNVMHTLPSLPMETLSRSLEDRKDLVENEPPPTLVLPSLDAPCMPPSRRLVAADQSSNNLIVDGPLRWIKNEAIDSVDRERVEGEEPGLTSSVFQMPAANVRQRKAQLVVTVTEKDEAFTDDPLPPIPGAIKRSRSMLEKENWPLNEQNQRGAVVEPPCQRIKTELESQLSVCGGVTEPSVQKACTTRLLNKPRAQDFNSTERSSSAEVETSAKTNTSNDDCDGTEVGGLHRTYVVVSLVLRTSILGKDYRPSQSASNTTTTGVNYKKFRKVTRGDACNGAAPPVIIGGSDLKPHSYFKVRGDARDIWLSQHPNVTLLLEEEERDREEMAAEEDRGGGGGGSLRARNRVAEETLANYYSSGIRNRSPIVNSVRDGGGNSSGASVTERPTQAPVFKMPTATVRKRRR